MGATETRKKKKKDVFKPSSLTAVFLQPYALAEARRAGLQGRNARNLAFAVDESRVPELPPAIWLELEL